MLVVQLIFWLAIAAARVSLSYNFCTLRES